VESVLADRSGQPPHHMVLTEQLGRGLRPVAAVQGLMLLLYPLVVWPLVVSPFVLWHAVPVPSLTKKIGRAPAIDAVRLERVPARQAPARRPHGTRREPLRAAAFPP
jgi:hypothetical protein